MNTPAFAVHPNQTVSRRTLPLQPTVRLSSSQPWFGARLSDSEEVSDSRDSDEESLVESQFEMTSFEKACVSAVKTSFKIATLPVIGLCKGYEYIRNDFFDRLLKADNANELISKRYPDLRTGKYDAPLHARLRWLAQTAAQGDPNRIELFEKALKLPRVQALLEFELSAKPGGKMSLSEKISAYGKDNPRLQSHLIEQVGQSIRRGENWSHFEVVSCNHPLRQALAAQDVAGALDALGLSKITRSDLRQATIPERLLMNPHNLAVLSQALGGENEAKAFIENMITLEIERDLKGHAYKDYQAEMRAKYPELYTDHFKTEANSVDLLQGKMAGAMAAEENPWRWTPTTDEKLEKEAKELAALTMQEYQKRSAFQAQMFKWANRAVSADSSRRMTYERALQVPEIQDLLEECLKVQDGLTTRRVMKMPLKHWMTSLESRSLDRVHRLEAEIQALDTPEAAKSRGENFKRLNQLFYTRNQALLFMENILAESIEEDLQEVVEQAQLPVLASTGQAFDPAKDESRIRSENSKSALPPADWSEVALRRMAHNLAQETIEAYLSRLPREPKNPPDFWEMDKLQGRSPASRRPPAPETFKAKHYGLKRLFTEA